LTIGALRLTHRENGIANAASCAPRDATGQDAREPVPSGRGVVRNPGGAGISGDAYQQYDESVQNVVYALHMLKERLQILVRPDQRQRLEAEARRRGCSVGALIREAVDANFGGTSTAERMEALEHIRIMSEGKYLAPEKLNELIEEERLDEALKGLNANR